MFVQNCDSAKTSDISNPSKMTICIYSKIELVSRYKCTRILSEPLEAATIGFRGQKPSNRFVDIRDLSLFLVSETMTINEADLVKVNSLNSAF